jgi:flavin reductase (DIM6/NTAB) family NADH-FMN oxidoreductase RutF
MPVNPDEFRNALSRFASGVTVVTTRDNAGRFHGITVSAFSSVSLEPPLILICIEKATASHQAFHESGIFVVNVLSSEQREVSEHFASPAADKFEGAEHTIGSLDLPVLAGCVATLECRVKNTFDGGDHTIMLASVESTSVEDGDPLVYFRGTYGTTTADA